MEREMEKVWIEKLAIQELCSRYCQTIDAQDSDGWARCFLPDGAFEFDGHVVRGYAALREYADAHTRVLRARHMTLNHLYDLDGDRAIGRATTVVSIATPSGYKIMGQGAYHDDLVKVGGEWKIRHRRVVNDHLVSDPAKPVNLADPDVAALVQQLINTADDLARRGSGE
jgi:ketosteroid isomerase-like protein